MSDYIEGYMDGEQPDEAECKSKCITLTKRTIAGKLYWIPEPVISFTSSNPRLSHSPPSHSSSRSRSPQASQVRSALEMAAERSAAQSDVKVVLYSAQSLDGYIARPDGSVGWLSRIEEAGNDFGFTTFMDSVDVLIMGSTSYKQVLGFSDWPYAGKPSYIMTRNPKRYSTTRDDIFFTEKTPAKVVDMLARLGHRKMWLMGGSLLTRSFLDARLVHEATVAIIPVLLGAGISLSREDKQQSFSTSAGKSEASSKPHEFERWLTLEGVSIDQGKGKTGAVILHYRNISEDPPTFNSPIPSSSASTASKTGEKRKTPS